ncbi:MAG: metal ABC transporter ATP-binding protein [Oscillospiraceae bacterium]|nr:metal ABC transporter ATP-binding protein [Oscillospiraceae bacterium]MDD4546291.1 metal ABC transporter ATP-binding protein [Oscillospiraceae bacterium]
MAACGLHCLKIKHITVAIGDNVLIRDINMHAHCGELTAIIGCNGAGKSTLLKAILGELAHTGSVEFSGHDGAPAEGLRIGYVPQSLKVDGGSPSTVYDMMASLVTKYPIFLPRRPKTVKYIKEHLNKFNAVGLLDKKLGQLSGGELQRVLLATATLPKPDLLVLDEPVSGIDRAGMQLFYKLIVDLKSKLDMVIILVSHDLEFVRNNADHVLLINRGVEATGSAQKVFASAAFRREFPNADFSHKGG